jgi:cytochrome oxidase Cu insertion factor (SCO1/SenC/PrrC family)
MRRLSIIVVVTGAIVASVFFFWMGAEVSETSAPTTQVAVGRSFSERPELSLGRSEDYDYDPPEPGSYRLPVLKEATSGRVLGADGKPQDLGAVMDGHITVLSFIYTRCRDPKACPYATGVLYQVHQVSQQDPVISKNLRLITLSFDPAHDTPRIMEQYSRGLKSEDTGSDWLFLTTPTRNDLAPILESYGQQVDRKKDPDDPLGPFYHLLRVYLVDRSGMIRNIYSSGLLDPRLVLTDVRTLLLEEG